MRRGGVKKAWLREEWRWKGQAKKGESLRGNMMRRIDG